MNVAQTIFIERLTKLIQNEIKVEKSVKIKDDVNNVRGLLIESGTVCERAVRYIILMRFSEL